VLLVAAIVVITAVSFYLNAVFAFTISQRGSTEIRPAFTQARHHLAVIAGVGIVVGLSLGFSTIVVPRWGVGWFAFSLGS
jgi:hypothetical protein